MRTGTKCNVWVSSSGWSGGKTDKQEVDKFWTLLALGLTIGILSVETSMRVLINVIEL